jgi:signal transduction histidine kinase
MATSIIIGGFIFINSIEYIKDETNNKLVYMSKTYAQESSSRLRSVETIIDVIHSQIHHSFDTGEMEKRASYLEGYEKSIDGFFRDTAIKNDDFESIYITFNSELTNEFREIWYLVIEEGETPVRVNNELYNKYTDTPTKGEDAYPNISLFNPENPAMDYYYKTLKTENGAWYEPVPEVGFPMSVITFARTVYKDKLLIGVIGIDINIESIRQSIKELEVMGNGYAALLNDNLEVIVHPEYPEYTSLKETDHKTWRMLKDFTENSLPTTDTKIYSDDNNIYSCSRLSNGWILVIALVQAEIFKPLQDLAYSIIIIGLLITGFSFLAARAFSNYISVPVEAAAEQLRHLKIGDYTLHIPPELLKRDDEIGDFVKSADIMAEIIRAEVEKNRQKDAVLTYQSRLAKTGEMIAHIAHQWRQPLNNLNLILSNIREDHPYAITENVEIDKSLIKCGLIIKDMSRTIDDFRYFLNPRTNREHFTISSSISFVIELMEYSLKSNNIKINSSFDDQLPAYGSANEFTQVISNIMYNARDALQLTPPGIRRISITTSCDKNTAVVNILNNGPAIPTNIMDQLFKPYFTTKSEDKGTGIGLYMSRLIIEKHFSGTIAILNTKEGVLCHISIPLKTRKEGEDE